MEVSEGRVAVVLQCSIEPACSSGKRTTQQAPVLLLLYWRPC